MKLHSFFQSFGFTRNETKVILMLGTTLLLGVGIRYYHSDSGAASDPEKGLDYSIPDSIFELRSGTAPQAPSTGTPLLDSSRGVPGTARSAKSEPGAPVNINTATSAELVRLPGIGPAFAERILSYRKLNGPFTSVDELQNVKGIGAKRLERLRPFVRVR